MTSSIYLNLFPRFIFNLIGTINSDVGENSEGAMFMFFVHFSQRELFYFYLKISYSDYNHFASKLQLYMSILEGREFIYKRNKVGPVCNGEKFLGFASTN